MAKLTNTKTSNLIKTIIYGPPKTGKTHLAGSLAEEFNVLWFDLENGIDTLRDSLPPHLQEKINVISVRDTTSQRVALETVLTFLRGRNPAPLKICTTHGKINCPICSKSQDYSYDEVDINALGLDTVVVIDSLTQLTASAVAAIGARINTDPGNKNVSIEDELDYLKKFGFDEWELLRKIFTEVGTLIQAAPVHILCITHEQEVTMEDGTKKLVPVMGSSSFAASCCKYFGDVVYCYIKMKSYLAQSTVDGSSQVTAGSRTGLDLSKLKDKQLTLSPSYKSKFSSLPREISNGNSQTTHQQTNAQPGRTATGVLSGFRRPT